MLKITIILFIGLILRLYGINWDSGFHLHPDERMILMVADRIHFFDKLNPHFFNYGSLPIYLLKGASQLLDFLFNSQLANYKGMLYVGRTFSIIFDVSTVLLIYKIILVLPIVNGRYRWVIALFSSFFYAIAFFPIQNSHFFTVDILFTFLSTFLFYRLLLYTKDQSLKSIIIIGIVFAALFATKFTAVIFLPIVFFVIVLSSWLHWKKLISHLLTFTFSLLTFNFLFMPYAFLDPSQFIRDVSLQLTMNKDPYIFPYTLQYVNTLPYWYYLKNIFLWGLGPVISMLSLVGLYQILKIKYQKYILNIKKKKYFIFDLHILYLLFYILYFLVIGASAVKFMRYMLPMYPFFAIMAGYAISSVCSRSEGITGYLFKVSLIGIVSLWSLMFINIYSQPNTRVTATEWILKNIPAGSSLAVEYWDDYLPLYGSERYYFNELHLYYQPDNDDKWQRLNSQLQQSDYLVIASNRLYASLQKFTDCTKYKMCYPKTAEYYQKLFNGELHFKKIAEFSVRPGIQIGSFKFDINDESADESFTVFDHPKVMIFKRI